MVRSMSRDNAASGCIPQPVIRIVRHIHPAALLRVERLAEGQGVARRPPPLLAHRADRRAAPDDLSGWEAAWRGAAAGAGLAGAAQGAAAGAQGDGLRRVQRVVLGVAPLRFRRAGLPSC